MRDLKRNKRPIWFANLSNDITDEWGNKAQGYGSPQPYALPISLERGETEPQGYGDAFHYYQEMVTHDMNCPIDEFSHLWIDSTPDEPYDYVVKRKSKSLNCIVYKIEKVDVS